MIFLNMAIILVVIILLFIMYMSRNFIYWKKLGVKQITPYPVIGNFADYFFKEKSPGNILKEFYYKYKNYPYVGIYTFDTPCLLLIDPNIIKSILITNFHEFSEKFMKSSSKDPLSNRSLPFLDHKSWSNLRRKLTPAFSLAKLKSDFNYLEEVTKDLDEHLESLNLSKIFIYSYFNIFQNYFFISKISLNFFFFFKFISIEKHS